MRRRWRGGREGGKTEAGPVLLLFPHNVMERWKWKEEEEGRRKNEIESARARARERESGGGREKDVRVWCVYQEIGFRGPADQR